jgi:hypothetical protein
MAVELSSNPKFIEIPTLEHLQYNHRHSIVLDPLPLR